MSKKHWFSLKNKPLSAKAWQQYVFKKIHLEYVIFFFFLLWFKFSCLHFLHHYSPRPHPSHPEFQPKCDRWAWLRGAMVLVRRRVKGRCSWSAQVPQPRAPQGFASGGCEDERTVRTAPRHAWSRRSLHPGCTEPLTCRFMAAADGGMPGAGPSFHHQALPWSGWSCAK